MPTANRNSTIMPAQKSTSNNESNSSKIIKVRKFKQPQKKSEIVSKLENFIVTLFKQVGKNTKDNMCISPISVAALLCMVHAGAKGKTSKELKEALGLDTFSDEEIHTALGDIIKSMKGDENFELKLVNLCYLDENYQITEKFKSIMESNFEATPQEVDFSQPETRKKINEFVEEFTNHKISDLFPNEFDPNTRLVLINAIHFKGDWSDQFDPELTRIKPFYLGSKNDQVDVSMMCLTKTFRTGELDSIDARFVELPYEGKKVSMVIILPNEVEGLEKLEANLSAKVLDKMEKAASWEKLCVEIPKFKIETKIEDKLVDALNEMGIKDLFSDEADLSGVSGLSGLFCSGISQKCFIEVDEKGTEAAAVTSSEFADSVPTSFKVDHPAVFLLKDNETKMVLFIGRLTNPTQN